MKINNITTFDNKQNNPNFKSIMQMSSLSRGLYTLGNNDMLNASAIDIFAMDTPRSYVEFKHRGKQAGIEMAFREFTGTFIAEFSAILFALGISKLVSKFHKSDIKINSDSWATNKTLDTFNEIYDKSKKTPEDFIKKTVEAMHGLAGKTIKSLKDVSEEEKKPIIEGLTKLIKNKNANKEQTEALQENVKSRIINVLKADNNIIIKGEKNEVKSNLSHMLRDITDLGRNVFFNEQSSKEQIISKLKAMNKYRIMFAIPLSMVLGITNQYINRQLTKRRTGIDNFVGENGYENNVKNKEEKKEQKGLLAKKAVSAGIFLAMLIKVMGIKKPSDFINKLEFNGPATSGNTIKTVYGTLVLGRIFASKDTTELRETNVRDYLGFLSWLVLGGFVAKGVAQAMDNKQEVLFNVEKKGKGIKHWLSDVSLKTQTEVMAMGGKNAAKNLKKLNIAQLSGIAYSSVMLGVLLPMLNISMTKKENNKQTEVFKKQNNFIEKYSLKKFEKDINTYKM